jgi:hypothetical protein
MVMRVDRAEAAMAAMIWCGSFVHRKGLGAEFISGRKRLNAV